MGTIHTGILRTSVRRKIRVTRRRAILGDSAGIVHEPGRSGYVRVREITASGLSVYKTVRLRATIRDSVGDAVYLGYDEDDELAVVGSDFAGLEQQGGNPLLQLPSDLTVSDFVNQSQIITLLSHAISTPTTPTTDVAVRGWIYLKDGTIHQFNGERVALAAFIPAADLHLLAGLFLKTDDTIEVVPSTAQSINDPLVIEDAQECVNGISAGSLPVWFWRLIGGMTAVLDEHSYLDGRQFLNISTTGGGSSPWTTDTNVVNLVTDTDNVTIGSATNLGKLGVDGDTDEAQLVIQGHSTQTNPLAVFEDSAGADQVTIGNTGAVVINEQGNDADTRIEGDTDPNLTKWDASVDRVGIGIANPLAKVDIKGNDVVSEYALQVTPATGRNNIRVQTAGGSELLNINSVNNLIYNGSGQSNGDVKIQGTTDDILFTDASQNNMGVGTSTPDASARLHVVSTAKGAIPAPVMTAAQLAAVSSPAEGLMGYESDTDILKLYDGQRLRNHTVVGWLPNFMPSDTMNLGTVGTATTTLAANGGSVACAIFIPCQILLESVSVRNSDTTLQRTWGWDLYIQYLNNGNAGENTLARVANSSANETYTATAGSTRTITAASAPVYLGPGLYWLVIQNRHATNTFGISALTSGRAISQFNRSQTKTTTNPNGSTLDFVAATWTRSQNMIEVLLTGRVFGETTGY